jgi:hypothetical protein
MNLIDDKYFGFFEFEEAHSYVAEPLHRYREHRRARNARRGRPYYESIEVAQIIQAFEIAGIMPARHESTRQGLNVTLPSGLGILINDTGMYFAAAPSSPDEWRASIAFYARNHPGQALCPHGDELFKAISYAYATTHGLKVEGYTPPRHMLPLIERVQRQERDSLASLPPQPAPTPSRPLQGDFFDRVLARIAPKLAEPITA